MSKAKVFRNVLIGGAALAGAALWAVAPRGFKNKQKHYVPTVPDVWYAHRGLHDAGSGLTAAYAEQSGEYVALARRMAAKAGYGSEEFDGAIAPENSMAAFAAACEAGYGIELDIQLTRDGEVVVVHDADLGRVAGDPRKIKDLSYDDLTRIPLYPTAKPGDAEAALLPGGEENPPLVVTPSNAPEGYYQHVPLFSDVLKLVDGRVPLIVEYKFENNSTWDDRDVELMEKGHALLEAYSGAFVVESFHPGAVNWYKENHPEVCRGQLACWPGADDDVADAAGADEAVAGAEGADGVAGGVAGAEGDVAGDAGKRTAARPAVASASSSPMDRVREYAAGSLVFDWLSRPDFVAYDWRGGVLPQVRLTRAMGAMPVAWTVRSQDEYAQCADHFDRCIFEAFIPQTV